MDHPRARVALEERGRWLPNWLLRRLYRPLIGPTAARFEQALVDRKTEKLGSGSFNFGPINEPDPI